MDNTEPHNEDCSCTKRMVCASCRTNILVEIRHLFKDVISKDTESHRTTEDDYLEAMPEDKAIEAVLLSGINAAGMILGRTLGKNSINDGSKRIADLREVVSTEEGISQIGYILQLVDYLSIKAIQLSYLRNVPRVGQPEELIAILADGRQYFDMDIAPIEGETYH